MRTDYEKKKRQVQVEFDAVSECVRSMAWHGFQSREMFLQSVDELREHLDKMAELYKEL
jgi:hypothetical protein